MSQILEDYRYRGARATILLHEREMRRLLEKWRKAKTLRIALPQTEDPDYQSLEHLLHHVLRAARGYMTWMCEKLNLPDPEIEPAPPPECVEAEAERYLEHLFAKWRVPLAQISEEQASQPSFKSRWGMDYSVDSMLEHALVHPMKHAFQLEALMAAR